MRIARVIGYYKSFSITANLFPFLYKHWDVNNNTEKHIILSKEGVLNDRLKDLADSQRVETY